MNRDLPFNGIPRGVYASDSSRKLTLHTVQRTGIKAVPKQPVVNRI